LAGRCLGYIRKSGKSLIIPLYVSANCGTNCYEAIITSIYVNSLDGALIEHTPPAINWENIAVELKSSTGIFFHIWALIVEQIYMANIG